MLDRYKPLILITIMLIVSALACRLGGRSQVELGETFQSDAGGFILQTIPDYEFEEFFGMVLMTAPGVDPDIGPYVIAYGEVLDEEISSQEVLDYMKMTADGFEFGSEENKTIDGVEGLLADFSGVEKGTNVQGKVFVAMPRPMQEFYIIALAPEDEWKDFEPIFDAVLETVSFIDADPFAFDFDDWDDDWDDDDWDEPFEDIEEVWEEPIETAPAENPYLGEVYYPFAGDYSFRKIVDYDFNDDFGWITMAKPGVTSYAGPLINIASDIFDGPMTTEDLVAMVTDDPDQPSTRYFAPVPYVLDGHQGLMTDFDGMEGNVLVQGRMFSLMLTPYKWFSVYAVAPLTQWVDLEPRFEALLESIEFSTEAAEPAQIIRQWAVGAEASSEYSSDDYSAMQATGEPAVNACEENPRAWASLASNTEEYLILYYETPVNPIELVIYQSHNPSQIVEVNFIDTTGELWPLWSGAPQESEFCPDVWTYTFEYDEVFYTDTVVIWVDQSILGLGWVEIDAVELVGYPMGGTGSIGQTPTDGQTVQYHGLMAGPVYQGWLNIVVGQTRLEDLDRIMPIPKELFIPEWKPYVDHAYTFTYEMPWPEIIGFVEINTDGYVYSKTFNNFDPTDFRLESVNRANFESIQARYKGQVNITYAQIANDLGSGGFLTGETLLSRGETSSTFWWIGTGGEAIVGRFYDGVLHTMDDLDYTEP